MAEPITREEIYLNSIANGESVELTPITREEMFLAKASGQDVKTPTPITRKEMFLSKISSGGVQLQEKTVEITENGTTEITADEGKALSKVTAVVSVPTSTASKLPQVVDRTVTEITAEDLKGATMIKDYAFSSCESLTSITIPNSITSIGDDAFWGCTSLTSVYYDGDIASWLNIAFEQYDANPLGGSKKADLYIKNTSGEYDILTNLVIPNDITEIKRYVFYGCNSLAGEVVIPNSVTKIGNRAFSTCSNITSVTIPSSVTNFEANVFEHCDSLESAIVNIVGTLNYSAFEFCGKLKNVVIGNEVTSIPDFAFRYCGSLTSLNIPSSVVTLGSSAFQIGSSTNKATITFLGTTPPTIKTNTFYANYLNKIIVPKGCGDAYRNATNWANFADYIEEAAE